MTGWESFAHLQSMEQMERRAYALADNHFELRRELVKMRLATGMTQKDVADFLGVQPQSVAKYERYDWDPRLSTLERYANAVGAVIETRVRADDGELEYTVIERVETLRAPSGVSWTQTIDGFVVSDAETAGGLGPVEWANLDRKVTFAESKRCDFAMAA